MTDKQITIDGIDVSGCIFHSLTTMGYAGYNYCKCFECVCECHNDCYYKQLKHKEQECEELKRLIAKQKNAKIQLSKLKDKQYKEFCDMKQTLIEIKEIAETADKCLYATKSDDYTDGYRWLGSIILQIISECEVKNE